MSTIEKLRAAHAAATPGEWAGNNDGIVGRLQEDGDNFVICDCVDTPALGAWPEEIQNAEFIALAHNHMPDLLEMAEQLDRYLTLQKEDNEDAWIVRETLHKINAKLKGTQS